MAVLTTDRTSVLVWMGIGLCFHVALLAQVPATSVSAPGAPAKKSAGNSPFLVGALRTRDLIPRGQIASVRAGCHWQLRLRSVVKLHHLDLRTHGCQVIEPGVPMIRWTFRGSVLESGRSSRPTRCTDLGGPVRPLPSVRCLVGIAVLGLHRYLHVALVDLRGSLTDLRGKEDDNHRPADGIE